MAEIDMAAMEDYLVTRLEAHSYLGDSANITTIEARRDWSYPDERHKAMGFAPSELPGLIVQNQTMYGKRVEPRIIAKDTVEYSVPIVINGICHTSAIETSRDLANRITEEVVDSMRKTSKLPGKWGTDGLVDVDTISGMYFMLPQMEDSIYGITTVFLTMKKVIST
jgi:hypothetical protein